MSQLSKLASSQKLAEHRGLLLDWLREESCASACWLGRPRGSRGGPRRGDLCGCTTLNRAASAAERMSAGDQVPYWVFVGAVAGSFDAAPVPDDLRVDYEAAVARSEPLIRATLAASGHDECEVIYLLQALAAVRGHRDVAFALEGFADGEFHPTCPSCDAELYVSVRGEELIATAEDPVTEKPTRETAVEVPRPSPATVDPGAPTWEADRISEYMVALAHGVGCDALAKRLGAWEGTVTCPACDHRFPLRDTLLAQGTRRMAIR